MPLKLNVSKKSHKNLPPLRVYAAISLSPPSRPDKEATTARSYQVNVQTEHMEKKSHIVENIFIKFGKFRPYQGSIPQSLSS